MVQLALMVVLLTTTAVLANGTNALEEPSPYRRWSFELADVCPDGLPWTDDPPLSFPARRPRDAHGVPMVRVDGIRYYRPGALAINGMKRIDAYRDTGDGAQLEQALEQATRLRKMSLDRRGATWLPFRYDYLPAGQRAPWFNAMSQGLVLSFYVRLFHVTGQEEHLDAARRVFRSFLRLGRQRSPWVAYVGQHGFLWLEHYPRRKPDHVLNAHLHAIFGIYEYWQATRSQPAQKILEGAITTMRAQAHRYRRRGSSSFYGLRIRSVHRKYHEIHIWQFRLLAKISGDPYFERLAQRLGDDAKPVGYVPGRPAIHGPRALSSDCPVGVSVAPTPAVNAIASPPAASPAPLDLVP